MCAASTEDMDLTAVYESLFQDRYTEREPGYAEVCKQPFHRIPAVVPWPPRPAARRSVWSDDSTRSGSRSYRSHGNSHSRNTNHGYSHHRHDGGGGSGGHSQYGHKSWGHRREYHDLDGVENHKAHKEDSLDFDACLKEYQLTKPQNGIAASQTRSPSPNIDPGKDPLDTGSDNNGSQPSTPTYQEHNITSLAGSFENGVGDSPEPNHAGSRLLSEPCISTSALAKYRVKPKMSNDQRLKHQPLPYQLQQKEKVIQVDKKRRTRQPFKLPEVPGRPASDSGLPGVPIGMSRQKALSSFDVMASVQSSKAAANGQLTQAQAAFLEKQRQKAESAARSQKVIQEALKAAGSVPRKPAQLPPMDVKNIFSDPSRVGSPPKRIKTARSDETSDSIVAVADSRACLEVVNETKLRIRFGLGNSLHSTEAESPVPVPSVNSILDEGGHIKMKLSLTRRAADGPSTECTSDAKSKRSKHKHKKHKHHREETIDAPPRKKVKV